MSRRSSGKSGVNIALGLFATVIVVAGVVGSAFLSSMWKNAPQQTATSSTPPVVPVSRVPQLLLVNESSVSLASPMHELKRVSRSAFDAKMLGSLLGEGAQAANGSVVRYNDVERSHEGKIAVLDKPKSDGASVLDISEGGTTSTVVLRDSDAPLTQAQIHGWSSRDALFVSAIATSTRNIYEVDSSGSVAFLGALPDSVLSIEERGGALWYTTAQPGQGIESEPVPPSELHRVTEAGDVVVVKDDTRLILNEVPGGAGELAYLTSDGQAMYLAASSTQPLSLGKKHPLLILQDGEVVLRDGFALSLEDPKTGKSQKLGDVPEGRVEVYEVPQNLDVSIFPR